MDEWSNKILNVEKVGTDPWDIYDGNPDNIPKMMNDIRSMRAILPLKRVPVETSSEQDPEPGILSLCGIRNFFDRFTGS